MCIFRDVPAWQRPRKISGVLTFPWAPLLLLLTAFWPAHSLQLHSKHQQASVGHGPFLKKNKHRGSQKGSLRAFCSPLGHPGMPGPHSQEGRRTPIQVEGWEGSPPGTVRMHTHRLSYFFYFLWKVRTARSFGSTPRRHLFRICILHTHTHALSIGRMDPSFPMPATVFSGCACMTWTCSSVHAQPERTGDAPAGATHGHRHDGRVLPLLRTQGERYIAIEGGAQK